MVDNDWLAREFETHRGRLRSLAYRMLGSLVEADDAVQEAWLRLSRSPAGEVENLGAWLTTVTGRICLDMLRSRQAQPESDITRQREVAGAFPAASRAGDFAALVAVLDPDVVLRADGGGGAPDLSRVLRGAAAVARQALMFARMATQQQQAEVLVNGGAGLVSMSHGKPTAVMAFTIARGKIVEIDILADPERLSQLDLAIPGD
jgi:RNA polymerase sigma factor (sigma-70 family)